jgi:inner membrane protein
MQIWARMRFGLKAVMVVGMTLAILIPLMMIRGTISERQSYRQQAVESIAASYAGEQRVAGPVLVVPYTETVEAEERNNAGVVIRKFKQDGEKGAWTFFPENVDLDGNLVPSTRRLGLHEVRVYELKGTLAARFRVAIPADANPELPRKIGQPWLSYDIADVRGLAGSPQLRVDGRELALRQGIGSREGSGVHVRLPAPVAGTALALDTRLAFALGGTESLTVVPLAKRNRIVIDSSWQHPQFNGDFLPRKPRIDGNGFHAEWEVSSLASNAQAQYLGKTKLDAIGISLVEPVNVYSQADRASKYGLLFVALTFVGFFMLEVVKQLRIHPIQYGLVGLALAIFFLLLVSLSEHIAFGWSYLIASVACIGLLGVYVSSVLRSTARGLGFATMLGLLYAALYGLLVSEDNALVLGAGLLFVILATIMILTRKIDWYGMASLRADEAQA